MKKYLACLLLLYFVTFVPLHAQAEDITYPGASLSDPNTDIDSNLPSTPNSLFPNSPAGNTVTVIPGGTIPNHVFGGIAYNAEVSNNTVIFDGAQISGNVTGGWANSQNNTSNLTGNKIIINSGKIGNAVYGAWLEEGSNVLVKDNSVLIHNGTFGASIYGAYAQGGGIVTENLLTIHNATTQSGANFIAAGYAGTAGLASVVTTNTLTITGGTFAYSDIYGGKSTRTSGGDISNNTVIITGGTIGGNARGNVYGGYGFTSANGNAITVNNNTARISDATVHGNVYGGYTSSSSTSDSVNNNKVFLGGTATIDGNVYGGYSEKNSGTTSNNAVNLADSVNVAGDVYGGSKAGANTVNLLDGTITVGGTLFGNGAGVMDGTLTASSGSSTNALQALNFLNTNLMSGAQLNLTSTSANALHVQNVANNGLISFFNQTATQNIGLIEGNYTGSGSIGLDVKFGTNALETDADSIEFVTKPTSVVQLQYRPATGSSLGLNTTPIHVVTFTGGAATDGDVVSVTPNVGVYTTEILRVNNKFYLYLTNRHAGGLGKPHTGSEAARLAIANKGVDMLLQKGLNDAITKTGLKGWGVAAQVGYDKERLNTGSHVDVQGMSGLLTLAYNKSTPYSVGIFGEFFKGDYDTSNNINIGSQSVSINGKGDAESYGGGVFFQYRPSLADKKPGDFIAWLPGFHTEVIGRLGYSYADFENDADVSAKIDRTGTMHYGAALGAGYVLNYDNTFMIDFYGNTIWTHQEGTTVNDNLQQEIKAKDSDSLRLIAGIRAGYAINDHIRPYVGLSLDYETMGDTDVYVDNLKGDSASLEGVTGIAQAGVSFRTAKYDNLFFDIKGSTSFGKREGGGGAVSMRLEF